MRTAQAAALPTLQNPLPTLERLEWSFRFYPLFLHGIGKVQCVVVRRNGDALRVATGYLRDGVWPITFGNAEIDQIYCARHRVGRGDQSLVPVRSLEKLLVSNDQHGALLGNASCDPVLDVDWIVFDHLHGRLAGDLAEPNVGWLVASRFRIAGTP